MYNCQLIVYTILVPENTWQLLCQYIQHLFAFLTPQTSNWYLVSHEYLMYLKMKIEFQDTIYVSFAVTETKWQIINCWDLPLHCRHGTACAGIIAAVKNQNCSIGVAYDSQFAGNTLCVIFAFIFLPSIHFTFFPSLFFLLSFLYCFFNNMGIWAKHQTKHVPRFVFTIKPYNTESYGSVFCVFFVFIWNVRLDPYISHVS